MRFQSYAFAIERALSIYDHRAHNKTLRDNDAIRILELLIDKFHFGDPEFDTTNEIIIGGVKFVEEAIQQHLNKQSNEVIVKILAVIWFVSNRRTKIGREYLDLIHHYTNVENDQGARLS